MTCTSSPLVMGGGDQEKRHFTGKRKKELCKEDEAIEELKARKGKILQMIINLFEQMIEIVCARSGANVEMDDNPIVKEMITRGLAEHKGSGGA